MGNRRIPGTRARPDEEGVALLMVLIALFLFLVIGLYLALLATAEVRISDNFESYHRARNAALAGMNHARVLLRGVRFDDQLRGPDGSHDLGPAYMASSRQCSFRMPVTLSAARMMDILNPPALPPDGSDDGILNSGWHPGGNGVVLIPGTGIAYMFANPHGPGMVAGARYFVKASDNNGEASELALDPGDDPFIDGDGQIILRSTGVSRTLGETMEIGFRNNTAAIFEARFKRYATFELDAPMVVQSSAVASAGPRIFSGSDFSIEGGASAPAVALIDPVPGDGLDPAPQILSQIAPVQVNCLRGAGLPPSVWDITAQIAAHEEKRRLLDKIQFWKFMKTTLPGFADNKFLGAQIWVGGAPAFLGSYDPALPSTSPLQDPRVIHVDGDLSVDGNLEGAGLLAVTGRASVKGNFIYRGLILVVGAGELDVGGAAMISGGILVAGLPGAGGVVGWGTAKLSVGDTCRIRFDRGLIKMAVDLIPPTELSLREITAVIDP